MVKIKVPATSANLGSGFDSLGLAVSLYNYVQMQEDDTITVCTHDALDIPKNEHNLIYKSAKYLYDLCGRPLKGLYIEQTNNIPMARGLGSSSACIVAGLMGANTLMGNLVPKDELLNIAAVMEGHPDNATPAMIGGLVTAAIDNGKVYYVKQAINNDLRFVTIIPDFELKTSLARSALPQEIAHKDGVFNLSRAALMSVSLYSGNYKNLRIAAQDKLHQPYRLGLIRGAKQVFDACYSHGAYAAYISGAGSTLMAIVDEALTDFEPAIRQVLDDMGLQTWKTASLTIDNVGTTVSV